jgi:hypothetical protein
LVDEKTPRSQGFKWQKLLRQLQWKNDLQMIETLASSDAAVAKTFGQSGIYCWWGKDNWHSRSGLA